MTDFNKEIKETRCAQLQRRGGWQGTLEGAVGELGEGGSTNQHYLQLSPGDVL